MPDSEKKIIEPTPEQVESLLGEKGSIKDFAIHEVTGMEVCASVKDVMAAKGIPASEELKPGDEIFVQGLLRGEIRHGIVEESDELGIYWTTGGVAGNLFKCNDDRQCWVTTGYINLEAIEVEDNGSR